MSLFDGRVKMYNLYIQLKSSILFRNIGEDDLNEILYDFLKG